MTKTEHYQLNQWDASDYVRREDFNEDNRKIEEALADMGNGIPKIATGSYTGNGQYGYANQTSLELGFMAKLVIIIRSDAPSSHTTLLRGNAMAQFASNSSMLGVTWSTTGVSWYDYYNSSAEVQLNLSNITYRWFAIG